MMEQVQFSTFGNPADVLRVVNGPAPGDPGPRDVVVRMAVMPINPADLLMVEGRYGIRPDLPFTPGSEGAGYIEAIGAEVTGLALGDLVVPLVDGLWCEQIVCRAAAVIKVPAGTDADHAAVLKANPATAEVMLTDFADLNPGDWVIQNAANSAVGRLVNQFAKAKGLRMANIVRRQGAADILNADGADLVLIDDGSNQPMVEEFHAASQGQGAKLGFDAVGGDATNQIASCLSDGAMVLNYGMMSGQPCRVDPHHLVFRGIELRGFWLLSWFRQAGKETLQRIYAELINRLARGEIKVAVEARYPLADVAKAVAHAARAGRSGKVVLVR